MTPEQWKKLDALFHEALELRGEARDAHLAQACGGNEQLRAEAERLIAAHEREGSFIDSPILAEAAEFAGAGRDESPVGHRLGPYQVISQLGRGGMGEVYLAEDSRLGRKVALKVLPATCTRNPDRVRRFEREAKAASALSHPNILTIYEIGQAEGLHFIATEFVNGVTLRQRMASGGMSVAEALEVGLQIAGALSAAHEAGIIHRDIKPENVMLRRDGLVKVLDFGLAKLTEQPAATSQATAATRLSTEPGVVMGTVDYMSPEQARGLKVDHRSDIFSLGVVTYEMVAGRRPFEGQTASDLIAELLRREPAPASRWRPGLPPGLERVIGRMLEKECGARYQSAAGLCADLQQLKRKLEAADETFGREEGAASAGGGRRERGWARPRLWQAAAVACLVALAAIISVKLFRGSPPAPAPAIRTLAVLPFRALSPEAKEDLLGFGIANEIITKVNQVSGLTVRPASAVSKYATREVDALEAANQLQVEAVVEGSYQLAGDRLRASVNLIRVRDGASLWARTFDLPAADVFAIQDEVARQVAMQLRSRLSAEEQTRLARRQTSNPEAYKYYAKAMYHFGNRGLAGESREEVDIAIELLQKAIELDASYARARARLGHAYAWIADFNQENPGLMARAKEELRAAERLDPQLAEVHIARGFILWSHYEGWRIEAAIRELRLAESLDPSLNTIELATLYFHVGLEGQSDREFESALETDPTSEIIKRTYLSAQSLLAKPDAWLELNRRLFNRGPDGPYYLAKGMLEEAAPLVERRYVTDPEVPEARLDRALLLALRGQHREARAAVPRALANIRRNKRYHHYTYDIARIYALDGRAGEALRWLRETVDEGFPCYPLFARDSMLDAIRGDPEFIKFMAEMKVRWEGFRREFD